MDNFFVEISRGSVPGYSSIRKFGKNEDVGQTFEDIWQGGADHIYLTSASTVHLISTDTNDNQAGSGARSVEITGLDANFNEISETVLMHPTDGLTAGPSSTNTFIRLNRQKVSAVGAYGGTNAGDISVIEDTGSQLQGFIAAGDGQSTTCAYTIPRGKTGFLARVSITVDTGKNVDVKMLFRNGANITTAPFDPLRAIHYWHGLASPTEEIFYSHNEIEEMTDIHFKALGVAVSQKVEVDYDIILIDKALKHRGI